MDVFHNIFFYAVSAWLDYYAYGVSDFKKNVWFGLRFYSIRYILFPCALYSLVFIVTLGGLGVDSVSPKNSAAFPLADLGFAGVSKAVLLR